MHIFVINLNKRPERFKNALKNLRSVGLNDFIIRKEACTPERAIKEYTKYISMKAYNNITSNFVNDLIMCNWKMVACAISHIEIWKFIHENKIKEAVIIEDDILISDINKFKIVYNRGLNVLRNNSTDLKKIFLTFNKKNSFEDFTQINDAFTGIYFYMLNYNMADLLLCKIKPLTYQIDLQIGLLFKSIRSSTYNNICYNINNDCINVNKNFISDVQYYFIKLYDIYSITKFNSDICNLIYDFLPKKQDVDFYYLNINRIHGYFYDMF